MFHPPTYAIDVVIISAFTDKWHNDGLPLYVVHLKHFSLRLRSVIVLRKNFLLMINEFVNFNFHWLDQIFSFFLKNISGGECSEPEIVQEGRCETFEFLEGRLI